MKEGYGLPLQLGFHGRKNGEYGWKYNEVYFGSCGGLEVMNVDRKSSVGYHM
jgi:hypothetical protein